jgi:hypothetical protein
MRLTNVKFQPRQHDNKIHRRVQIFRSGKIANPPGPGQRGKMCHQPHADY